MHSNCFKCTISLEVNFMAARDNAFEYTETKYLTRREISNEIGVKITDEMWNRVLNYRTSFYSSISLKDNDNKQLYVCLCPSLASKLNVIRTRLSRLGESFSRLNETSGDKQHFRLTNFTQDITLVAAIRNINIDSSRAKRLISSENPYDDLEEGLLNYVSCLKYVEEHLTSQIDDNYLADLYSLLTGNPELTSFYRNNEVEDDDSRAMVARIYNHAYVDNIETMMNSLFEYLNKSKDEPVLKALITYFYVNYVRPFEKNNEEIAVLLAKAAVTRSDAGEVGALIPLEFLFSSKLEYTKKNFQEILLTGDVTYFISPVLPFVENQIAQLLDLLNEYTVQELRQDFYQEEDNKVEEVKQIEEPAPKEEEKVEIQKEVVIYKQEEIKPQEIVEEKPQEKMVEEADEENDDDEVFETIPVELIPPKIDEKEAKRLQEHLLELDYRLKKHEAYFFARHHALGSYYTIEQYKKTTKCVYETARTSMEHLVELGYYEKKKVGKKFVYTPKKRK